MPRWGLLRTNTARALGGFGSLKRQATVILNRVAFRGLYQIAHSESPVEKWDNSTRWRDQTIETERIACRPKWLPPAVPAALNGTGPFSMSEWSNLNRLTSTMRGRICCADRLRKTNARKGLPNGVQGNQIYGPRSDRAKRMGRLHSSCRHRGREKSRHWPP